jgi:hypothetical protein
MTAISARGTSSVVYGELLVPSIQVIENKLTWTLPLPACVLAGDDLSAEVLPALDQIDNAGQRLQVGSASNSVLVGDMLLCCDDRE